MSSLYRTFLIASQQVLIVMFLFFAASAHAATPVKSLEVKVILDQQGTVRITQNIIYSSPSKLNWKIFSKPTNLTVESNNQLVESSKIKVTKESNSTHLISTNLATSWKISYYSSGNLIRHNNRDQLFLKIIDKPPVPVFLTSINFQLPASDDIDTNISGNIYSLQGVSNALTKVISPTEINFSAGYAGTNSLITISSNWDKSVLKLGPLGQAKLSLLELDVTPWLAFGIILPVASLLVLLHLLWRQKKQEGSTDDIIDQPPSNTPAILVGVLVRKKIFPEEIAALLISLCQRGYLIIIKRSDSYFITKRKSLDENVEPWEKAIVKEMFGDNQNIKANDRQSLNNNALYSPRVREAFAQIYDVITSYAYFKENPHQTRIKNKLFALAVYYFSALAIIWIAVSDNSPYLILPLAGAMVVAQIIIKLSVKLANYTDKGLAARNEWLSFKNYLTTNKPLPFETSRNHTFEKYLPYAVAMNSTLAWAKRFDLSSITIIKPDWFVTYNESSTVDFAKEIALLTNEISKGITSLRGPLVS